MINHSYDGDPRIVITPDGADIVYRDGQPIMDYGLENSDIIALFTEQGWPGNALLAEPIGSDFESMARGTITKTKLIDIANAARRALSSSVVDTVSVTVSNPSGAGLEIAIERAPPGQDVQKMVVTRDNINWMNQSYDPASERLNGV